VISINLFSRKFSFSEFFTCPTTGRSRSHCSCLLSTAFAQYDQSRMDRHLEKFDEISRIRRDDGKVMIERVPPDNMIRPTCKAKVRYGTGNTHRGRLTVARALAKCFHPAGDESCAQSTSEPQPLSWSSRPLAEAREEPCIAQVAGAESGEIFRNFLFWNALPKERRDMLKGYASTTKDGFSPQHVRIRNNASSAPAEC